MASEASPVPAEEALLSVDDLHAHIETRSGRVRAVDGVSFEIRRGETLGLVGESGSGKSMLCLSLLRLLPKGGAIAGGRVLFRGEDLLRKSERQMRAIRGRHISMILQDPLAALNPVFSIGAQVMEPIRIHQRLRGAAARARMVEALRLMHIASPERRAHDYPHQLSGGMRQRVLGAIALSCRPELLIADEPTTSLDVTVQAQYLALLREIQRSQGIAILFVTHDLGIVAHMCHRVCVMYAGRLVEAAPVLALFERPAHPYTRALLAAVPRPESGTRRLSAIAGAPPALDAEIRGCPFAPRCPEVDERCRTSAPPLLDLGAGRLARCWKPAA